ncbi:MAG: type III pantothenate kinase [Bacteroidia bacterium]|nr:type III pantothenate kinase [Bacteroidia bacterium]MDW8302530.1 type III pantothenate kinase [Bacteroidia bacterium]
MRYLLIDIGNTALKWALYDDENCINQQSIPLNSPVPFSGLLYDIAVIANVGYKDQLLNEFLSNLKKPVLSCALNAEGQLYFQNKIIPLPITIAYKTPQTLGSDRIASVLGAYTLFPEKDVIIVDLGTCIKYEILTKNKVYLGGAIAPGIQMRYQAMHEFTAKLPALSIPEQKPNVIGKNTQEAMHAGVMQATHCEIKGMIELYKNELNNSNPIVILSGGDAQYFEAHKNLYTFVIENLVFIGLHSLAKIAKQYL